MEPIGNTIRLCRFSGLAGSKDGCGLIGVSDLSLSAIDGHSITDSHEDDRMTTALVKIPKIAS